MATPAGGHYEGMPQLDPVFMPNLVFWLVVTLVVIYLILNRVALPRIAGIIDDRRTAIANDLDKASELKVRAEEAEAGYQQSLKDARAEAQRIVAEAKAEIQGDLDTAIAKADAEIAAKAAESAKRVKEIQATAMDNIAEVAKATAAELVSAVSPVSAPAGDVDKAIASLMKGS